MSDNKEHFVTLRYHSIIIWVWLQFYFTQNCENVPREQCKHRESLSLPPGTRAEWQESVRPSSLPSVPILPLHPAGPWGLMRPLDHKGWDCVHTHLEMLVMCGLLRNAGKIGQHKDMQPVAPRLCRYRLSFVAVSGNLRFGQPQIFS